MIRKEDLKKLTEKKIKLEIFALIDVVFLLLVFFIYALLTLSAPTGIQIDLPEGKGKSVEEGVIIEITAENVIYVNSSAVALNRVPDRITELLFGKKGNIPVIIRGDKQADLGIAVELLSMLKNKGIQNVVFETEEKE